MAAFLQRAIGPRPTLASIGLALALAGLCPLVAHAQSATLTRGVNQGTLVPIVTQSTPVRPTAEEQKMRDEWLARGLLQGPPLPVDPNAVQRSPIQPATPAARAAPATGNQNSFSIYRTGDQPPFPGPGKTNINEPSVGTGLGNVVFTSSNWDAAVSTDGGKTFSFVNPYTQFGKMDGGFCCDQTVIYDKNRDLIAWQLQYNFSSTTQTGGWKTAFAHSSDVSGGKNWCVYTWHPDSFGLSATGLWMDYPSVALTNKFIYYTTTIFRGTGGAQGSVMWRIPLDSANVCDAPVPYDFHVVANRFVFELVQGATSTMYWSAHNSTSSERIYSLADSSSSVSFDDVAVTPWFNVRPRVCTTQDGNNPCGRADGFHGRTGWVANGVIGWMWSSSQGGSFPYPYIKVARFNESTKALIDEPNIWSPNYAWIYNAVGINARGAMGTVVYVMGGTWGYPSQQIALVDDISGFWAFNFAGQSGSAGGGGVWGDYYSTRQHPLFTNSWVSATQYIDDTHFLATVHTLYQWYGRVRDLPGTVNTHDFNGDIISDILWRDTSDNTAAWLMNGSAILASGGYGAAPGWSVVGQRDFNADGKYDLLWRDGSGNTAIWLLNGLSVSQTGGLGNIPTTWSVAGTADFNGDGYGDILWVDGSGDVAIWLMNGLQISQIGGIGNAGTSWSVAGTADFNGDGKADILWRDNSGNTAIWLMNGLQIFQTGGLGNIPTVWSVVGTGDFNGDGQGDILWRDASGNLAIWLMNGSSVLQAAGIGNSGSDWNVAVTGDYNADAKSDILLRNSTTGAAMIWFMNGVQISSTASLGTVPLVWTIQGMNAD
jgi:hypothetical protein